MGAVILDVRANGYTGVARYGHRLLTESRPALEDLGRPVHAIVRRRDLAWLAPRFEASTVTVVAPQVEDGTRFLQESARIRDFVASVRPDLLYTTNYTMDHRYDGRFVFTVHDLTRLRFPTVCSDEEFVARYGEAEFQRLRDRVASTDPDAAAAGRVFSRYFEATTRDLAARAHRVATVSTASAGDIESLLDVAPERVRIVPSAVDEAFCPAAPEQVDELRRRLSLGERYFVYVGLASNHKRVDWLIRHFVTAARDCPRGTKLAIVGGDADQRADVRRALTIAGSTDEVLFIGRVTDADMARLYTGAVAYLSASAAEGFGLPPAEALACGTEAIVTDIGGHREVLGEHAHLFGVDDDAAFRRLVVDAAHERLPARAAGFMPPTWPRASAAFMDALRDALA